MKKKLIISLSALLVIALCVGGYLLYIMKFKEYDIADESVAEIIEDPFEIELPDGTIITLDDSGEDIVQKDSNKESGKEDGQASSDSTDESEDGGSIPVSGKGQSSKTPTNTSNNKPNSNTGSTSTSKPNTGSLTAGPGAKVTVASIKEKYNPAFAALEGQAEDKLNALIGRAKNEYSTKKNNGEKIDYGYFYNKYMSAATELEGRTDSVFNGVLKAIEKDLEKNGYDKSYAKSFKNEYDAQKKIRKESLMKKAVGR
ncbi:hypothetical protein QTL97_05180 [Sporosarcina thermotolerans]|uniref:Lipoprotein n=1 Tax=Sporosarcina thermotolerans TaxID=633404 RepID=A0AAW9A5J4_9BACL|nr:hypothetical protein [Sporosarcina thermotolerans]MDW0116317.1 hypothetical protein [Sporosarcina thermotolerans]WHT48280.1 hypothetical protein QNH10_20140 [Sporosarcina thermotolerans]